MMSDKECIGIAASIVDDPMLSTSVLGRRWNSKLVNRNFKLDIEIGYFFGATSQLQPGKIVYVCPEKLRSSASFIALRVCHEDGDGNLKLSIVFPLDIVQSPMLFSRQEQHVQALPHDGRRMWKLWSVKLSWECSPTEIIATVSALDHRRKRQALLVLRVGQKKTAGAAASAPASSSSSSPPASAPDPLGGASIGDADEADDTGELDDVQGEDLLDFSPDADAHLETWLADLIDEAGSDLFDDSEHEGIGPHEDAASPPGIADTDAGAAAGSSEGPLDASPAFACPCATFDPGALSLRFEAWADQSRTGIDILSKTDDAKHVPLGRTQYPPWEVSLVSYVAESSHAAACTSVGFIFWTYPQSRKGRVLSVSPTPPHIIKWPTAASHKEIAFSFLEVIHPALGVTVKRAKDPGDQSEMPASAMRLKRMFELAQSAQDTDAGICTLSTVPCHVCGLLDGDIRMCSLCLLAFHTCCAQLLVTTQKVQPVPVDFLPPSFVTTEGTSDPLCALCRAAHVKPVQEVLGIGEVGGE
jgi:hypothetical protein